MKKFNVFSYLAFLGLSLSALSGCSTSDASSSSSQIIPSSSSQSSEESSSIEQLFTVTWKNYDGTVLETDTDVKYDSTPSYDGDIPTRESDDAKDYTFSKWSPELRPVTSNVTYIAQYDYEYRLYTVTFNLNNGQNPVSYKARLGDLVDVPANPTKPGYTFKGWDNYIPRAVPGHDLTFNALYDVNKYTVTWKNYDGSVLETDIDVDYGATPSYDGLTPTRASDDYNEYSFAAWSPEISPVTRDTIYVAQYNSVSRLYNVTFNLNNGEEPVTYKAKYGDAVNVPANPIKTGYTFKGWDVPVPSNVPNHDITFNALYDINKYTVTWKNYDGSILETDIDVEYGSTPSYNGPTPTRASDDAKNYTFSNWSQELKPVIGNVTFVAEYDYEYRLYTVTFNLNNGSEPISYQAKYGEPVNVPADPTKTGYTFKGWDDYVPATVPGHDLLFNAVYEINRFTVRWENYNGSVLETDTGVEYGATPSYDDATPVKPADVENTYTFAGWSPEISIVTGNVTYVAQFNSTKNKYTIEFVNGSTVLQSEQLEYGSTPSYKGVAPTREADAQYTYTFKGWDSEIVPVNGNKTYTAVFTSTVNQYAITWKDGNGGTLKVDVLDYGATPSYSGVTPTKDATAQYSYSFNGSWSPSVVPVTGDATYVAQFSSSVNKYTVTWKNYDGSVLETDTEVEYGTVPSYDGATPVKPSDDAKDYTFSTWSPEVSIVTGDVEYTAQFDSEDHLYTITFNLNNGSDPIVYQAKFEDAIIVPDDPTKTGYTFTGWDAVVPSKVPNHDIVFNALYDINKYTVTWKNYDGTILETDLNVEYGSTPSYDGATPAKPDEGSTEYIFNGWLPEIDVVTDNVEYVAQFNGQAIVYTISFDLNGGSSPSYVASKEVLSFSASDFFYDVSKDNYRFRGWKYNNELIVDENGVVISTPTMNRNMTVVAYFTQTVKLDIVINSGFENAPETISESAEYPFNTNVSLVAHPKVGYLFVGWYYNNILISSSEEYKYMMWNDDATIEARFKYNTYHLSIHSYNPSLGQVMIRDKSNPGQTYQDDYDLDIDYLVEVQIGADTLTSVGFLGWYDNDNNLISSNAVYVFSMTNHDYELTAKWDKFIITYNLDGGINDARNVVDYNSESGVIALYDASKTGYTFQGWKYNDQYVTSINSSLLEDVTLDAIFTLDEYVITYNLNGGTNSPSNPDSYDYEDADIVLANPSRIGYSFEGWFTTSTFEEESRIAKISHNSTGNITLYAKWEIINYSIAYELNGGVNNPSNPASYNYEDADIVLANPSRVGYNFIGWIDSGDNPVVKIAHNSTGDITLYANWSIINYSIAYNLNGGTNNPSNPATYNYKDADIVLAAPSRTGYNFVRWVDSDSNPIVKIAHNSTGNVVVYAEWSPITYSITYELNGGVNNPSNPSTYTIEDNVTLSNPSRIGYSFGGWYDNSSFEGDSISIIELGSFGNKTLYAKWVIVNYSITYELNGGTNNPSNPATYNYEDADIVLASPSRIGYNFVRWFDGDDNTITKIFHNSTGSVTVYAEWSPISYSIIYELNGGINSSSNPNNYTIEDSIVFVAPSRIGYSFGGWFTASTFEEETITTMIDFGSTGDIFVYAKWTPVSYSITYELNGGTNNPSNPSTYTIEDSVALKQPSKPGYLFAGWYDNDSFLGDSISSIEIGSTGSKYLYAKWSSMPELSNFEYYVENTDIIITGIIDSTVTSIVVPGVVATDEWTCCVESIYPLIFSECTSITSITLPFIGSSRTDNQPLIYFFGSVPESLKTVIISEGCTSIGNSAFYDCSSLESIIIPNTIKTIGDDAFSGCSFLSSITIPNSVTSIGQDAFSGCSSLSSVTIPDSVTSIGQYAFRDCTSLSSVSFGNHLSSIGESAFYGCTSLSSIVIPNSVESIGHNAFSVCTSLSSITVPFVGGSRTENQYFKYIFGAVPASLKTVIISEGCTSIPENAFQLCLDLTSITIPDSVASIGLGAFSGCTKLTSINIPDSITSISRSAFEGCNSLSSIVIPDTVVSIGQSAFSNCLSLTSITIPDSVKTIEQYAFYACPFESIVIPNSVTSIGQSAFLNCTSLSSITLPFIGGNRTENQFFGYVFGASSFEENYNRVPKTLKTVIISEGCVLIPDHAFDGCTSLESIILSNSVTSIGSDAFYGCSSLSSVTILDSVTSIGDNAFYGCSSLSSITISNSAKSIGQYAFSGCPVGAIVIPNSVTSIGIGTFRNCTSLSSITIPFVGGSKTSNKFFSYIFGAENYTSLNYLPASLKTVIISEGCTSIGNSAFYGCSSLESIIIPNTIKTIGDDAFSGCSFLSSITIPDSVTSIGQDAFSSCTAEIIWGDNPSITSIGDYAFNGYKGTSITIPSTIESIGIGAFRSCTSLSSITIPDSVTSIGEYAFFECSSLQSITIPNGVTSIGESAFYGCTSLSSVVVPSSVTSIGSHAFSGCTSIESITLPFVGGSKTENQTLEYIFGTSSSLIPVPESVKTVIISEGCESIFDDAFRYCSKIKSITIPNSITSIGQLAFDQCSSLTSIVIPNGVTSIGYHAFYGCSSLESIVIPDSVTSIGESVFGGCTSLKSITLPFIGGSKTANQYFGYIFEGNGSIPESVKTVIISEGCTSIPDSAFADCRYIETISIPGSVISIEGQAFRNCSSLQSIVIPNGVTSIESSAFDSCISLSSVILPDSLVSIGELVFYNCSSLESIIIPKGISTINNAVFYNCVSLSSVSIPDSVTSIGESAFYKCSSLQSITIPNGVTSIGYCAFYGCSSLESIVIPDSVTSIGESAFAGCTSIESITLPFVGGSKTENQTLEYILGMSSILIPVPESLKTVIISEGYTSIPNGAFYDCTSLTSIILPNSVTSIESQAFYGCTSLSSISIPNGVISIGNSAFYNCTSLPSIILPNSVASIGSYVFYGCTSLESITLPFVGSSKTESQTLGYIFGGVLQSLKTVIISEGCTSIPNSAFSNWQNLTSITIPNSVTSIGGSAFDSCSAEIIWGNNPSVTSIGDYAFRNYSGASITIPNSVISIGYGAFAVSSAEIIWGNNPSVTSIGNYAFADYKGTSITIPNSVTSIGQYAFQYYEDEIIWGNHPSITSIDSYTFGFYNGSSVVIPSSVTSIGQYAFYICSSLESVTLPFIGGSKTENQTLEYIFDTIPESLKTVIISEGCTSIPTNAFSYCDNIETIVIPNSITSIGQYAFRNVTAEIIWGNNPSVTSIGNYAFADYKGTSITLPNSVTSIGQYAFQNYEGEIIWGNNPSITSIGQYAFADYKGTSITLPNSVATIGNYVFKNYKGYILLGNNPSLSTISNYAFSSYKGFSITLPNSVTSIGEYAFQNCSAEITWANNPSITSIGQYAFAEYKGTSITIPNSVTSIGNSAFYFYGAEIIWGNNPSITSIGDSAFSGYNGTSITIPNSVISIGENAFMQCHYLATVVIPNTVTSIGASAFLDCSSLSSVSILGQVVSIGDYAFSGCSSLESAIIPNFTNSIGCGAFLNCSSLESITLPFIGGSKAKNQFLAYIFGATDYLDNSKVPSSLKTVTIADGCTSIGDYAFYYCTSLSFIVIPNSVTSIGQHAFEGCIAEIIWGNNPSITSIGNYAFADYKGTSITIPNSVTSIGQYAFQNYEGEIIWGNNPSVVSIGDYAFACYKGNSITLPNFITSIGDNAFAGCSSLASVVIPNGTTTIGESAFAGCSLLETITIPNSVTSIGQSAFSGCFSLSSIALPFIGGTETTNQKLYYIFGNNISQIPDSLKTVIISEGCTSIPVEAFMDCTGLETITMPSTITSIKRCAFYNCSSLTSINVPNSVNSIGIYAFQNCSAEIVWGDNPSITSIGQYAFAEYVGTSIIIPNSVTSIGQSVFSGCYLLTSITLPFIGGSKTENQTLEYIFGTVPSSLKTVIITNGCTSIGDYAFYNHSFIESISIPNTVVTIGDNAFRNCFSLTSITIPNSVESIGQYAFSGCTAEIIWGDNPSITSIGDYAFYEYKGTSITIPSTIESIGNGAFRYCTSLSSVSIPDSVTSIGESAFFECRSLQSITIPNSVTAIGDYAFYGCISLETATVPNSVDSIGQYAFAGCSSLSSVALSNGITTIGDYAFYGCSSLASIVIPNSVTSIGESAFYSCSSLESITIPFIGGSRTENQFFSYIFGSSDYVTQGCIPNSLKTVIISEGCTSIPDNAFYYCTTLESITFPNSLASIGQYAFEGCTAEIIWCDNPSIASIDNYALSKYKGVSFTIPNSVTSIGQSAFYCCSSLESIVVPNGVTTIGQSAFGSCSSLESITMPFVGGSRTENQFFGYIFGATEPGEAWAFPSSIKTVTITEGYTAIAEGAFAGCSSLVSVTLPSSITSIGREAFYSCSSLESIDIPRSVNSIGVLAFGDCTSLSLVTLHQDYDHPFKTISDSAFQDCTSLESIDIPYSINYIGASAFNGCTSLSSITLPFLGDGIGNNQYLGYIFGAPTSADNSTYVPESLKTVIIHSSSLATETVYEGAFQGCSSLESISLLTFVSTIEQGAFQGCSSLETITLPFIGKSRTENQYLGHIFGAPENNDHHTYVPSSLTEVIIRSGCESIGQFAFGRCTSIKTIVIPNTVTSIGDSAFQGCSSLESIVIPNGVTSIEATTFINCISLSSVTIPNTVGTIAICAFAYCRALTSINFAGTIEEWNAITKDSVWNIGSAIALIHCTDGDVAIGD